MSSINGKASLEAMSTESLLKLREEYEKGQEELPTASSSNTFSTAENILDSQCHVCGCFSSSNNDFQSCASCQRVWYCSQNCRQTDSSRHATDPSKCCQSNLLEHVMQNLANGEEGEEEDDDDSPEANSWIHHNLCQVEDNNVPVILEAVAQELKLLLEICHITPTHQNVHIIGSMKGNSQTNHVATGIDMGMESLVLALNLWPGVYTIDACSGLHKHAKTNPYVTFVTDNDADQLDDIQRLCENGALGLKFVMQKTLSSMDPSDKKSEGIVGLQANSGALCRTYGRTITLPDEPFDSISHAVWTFAPKNNNHYLKAFLYLPGLLGLALRVVEENTTLQSTLTDNQQQKLQGYHNILKMARDSSLQAFQKYQQDQEATTFRRLQSANSNQQETQPQAEPSLTG